MNLVLLILYIFIGILTIVAFYPEKAAPFVAEFKRRWRRFLIQKFGTMEFEELAKEFAQKVAERGYDKEIAREVLNERKEEIIEEFGRRAADESLGPPTPLEKYY